MNSHKHWLKSLVSIFMLTLGIGALDARAAGIPNSFTVSSATASHWRSFAASSGANPGASISLTGTNSQFNWPAQPNPAGVGMLGGSGYYGVALLSPTNRVSFNGWLFIKNASEPLPPGFGGSSIAGSNDGYMPSFGPFMPTNGESGTWYAFIFRGNGIAISSDGPIESQFDVPVGVWKATYVFDAKLSIIPRSGAAFAYAPANASNPETYTFAGGANYDVQWTTAGASTSNLTRDGSSISSLFSGSQSFNEPNPPGSKNIAYVLNAASGVSSMVKSAMVVVIGSNLEMKADVSSPGASLTPADQTITLGQSATLTASIPDSTEVSSSTLTGDGVSVNNPSGTVAVSPASPGDKTYTLAATGWATLRWRTEFRTAKSLTLTQPDGTSRDVSGLTFAKVTQSGSYTLSVQDSLGNTTTSDPANIVIPVATATAVIHVNAPSPLSLTQAPSAVTATITPNKPKINLGESVSFTLTNAEGQASGWTLNGPDVSAGDPPSPFAVTPSSVGFKTYTYSGAGYVRLTWGVKAPGDSFVLSGPIGSIDVSSDSYYDAYVAGSYSLKRVSGGVTTSTGPVSIVMPVVSESAVIEVLGAPTPTPTPTPIPDRTLTIDYAGDGNGSTLPPKGAYTYADGTVVSISMAVDASSEFAGWSGDLFGTSSPATIVMNGDKTVTAIFNKHALLSQTIDFALGGYRDTGVSFPLIATSSSGLPVSFSIVSGGATLVGNVITPTAAGTVIVKASQAGDSTYAPAPDVIRQFDAVTPPKITFSEQGPEVKKDSPANSNKVIRP